MINFHKSILVIDSFDSGKTLFTAGYYLQRFLKERCNHSENKIEILGISETEEDIKSTKLKSCGIHTYYQFCKPWRPLALHGSSLIHHLSGGTFKSFAEYNQRMPVENILSDQYLPVIRNPEYGTLVQLLAETERDSIAQSSKAVWCLSKCTNSFNSLLTKSDHDHQSKKRKQGDTKSVEQHSQTTDQVSKKIRVK